MGQFTNEMTTLSTQNILNESVLVSASTIAKYSEVPIQRSPIYFTNFTWISLKILIAENISYLCYLGIALGEYTKYRDDSIGAVSRFRATFSGDGPSAQNRDITVLVLKPRKAHTCCTFGIV